MEEYSKFSVCAENINGVKKSIAKLQKKAKKLGVPELELVIDNPHYEEFETGQGSLRKIIKKKFFDVSVLGETPIINGWEFVASIASDGRAVIVRVKKSSNIENSKLTKYKDNPTFCEHCKSNRKRKNTYIVRNIESGEIVQVGSTCVKDFTGHTNPNSILAFYESLYDWEYVPSSTNYYGEINYGQYLEFKDFMSIVAYSTRNFGFKKSTNFNGSTASDALNIFYMRYNKNIKPSEIPRPEEIDFKNVEKAIKYFREETYLKASGDFQNYVENVMQILNAADIDDMIRQKDVNFVAPLIHMYLISEDRQKKFENKTPSEYVGEIKERKEFVLTLKKIFTIESDWGPVSFNTFEDSDGNEFVWKTQTWLEKDETYTIKATIKEHKEFRGSKQTIITRGKVI